LELQLFSTQDGRCLAWEVFLKHPLGELFTTIPFHNYEQVIPYEAPKTGPKPWFDLRGGIGLMVLKSYYGCSDKKLIDQLNHNKMMQFFCGINLKAGQQIIDDDVVSRWRKRFGRFLKSIEVVTELQLSNVSHWKAQMNQTRTNLADASCYESYVRYPTDVKLLWESIEYLYGQMKTICKYISLPMPRSKFKEQKSKYLSYQKSRKKTYKQRRRTTKRLLYLLNKYLELLPGLIGEMKRQESQRLVLCRKKANFFARISTIKKIYQQQQLHFDHPKVKIKDRIVSLAKPYLRPIVRGKEVKRVEFGMKVHEMQIDGINFIEHWDFNAFHEGIRMKKTLWRHQYLFRQKVKLFGGDQLYANNANRRYCSGQNIQTCFVAKGKPTSDKTIKKQKQQIRQLIAKERATRLEGSFGNKKNHYTLGKIKARLLETEMAWIFFGNLTANAVAMAKRRKPPPQMVA
jgi:hypothetical protein